MATAMAATALAVAVSACNDDLASRNAERGEGEMLAARKVAQSVSRSVPPNSYFNEGIKYRLWAYENNAGSNGNYLFEPAADNGIVAEESATHYIKTDIDNGTKLRGDINIYGMTDGESTAEDAFMPDADSSNARPLYTVTRDINSTKPEAGSVRNYCHPDYMRAILNYNSATATESSAVLEFRHIMSQVDLQVIQQTATNSVATSRYDLRIKKVAIKDVYPTETYDVVDGEFYVPAGVEKGTYTVWESNNDDGDDIKTMASTLVQTLVFPTVKADVESGKGIELVLTIAGNDAANFADEGSEDVVTVPVLSNQTYSSSQEAVAKPLVFEPNYNYTLQVVFVGNDVRVVTLVPRVYPWLDGETQTGTDDYDSFTEQEVGQAQLFNDLFWSGCNIGANAFRPTDEESFDAMTGYYYQADRNIPYYPEFGPGETFTNDFNDDVNKVYPVLNELELPGGKTRKSYPPSNERGYTYILELDDIYNKMKADSKLLPSFRTVSGSINGNHIWDDVLNQPTPPGWRLPTKDELYSIFPSTTNAGNITFLSSVAMTSAGDVANRTTLVMKNADVLYVHVPNNEDYPPYGFTENGNNGYNASPIASTSMLQEYDPEPGYSSEYVISKRYRDFDKVDKPVVPVYTADNSGGDLEWGTIYAIKKVGTDEAYRMRWQIWSVSETTNRYVLVISRYSCESTDRLLYKKEDEGKEGYYKNYDWDHPVAVLYFPILGMVGDDNTGKWAKGSIGNYGTEVPYWTSTPIASIPRVGTNPITLSGNMLSTARIKIGGTDRTNQFIGVGWDRKSVGLQIRCVRDYNRE